MEIILKQRIVGSIVIVAILSIVLPFIVISKDEVFNKKLISNIPNKPVYKISLPDSNYDRSGLNGLSSEVLTQAAVEDKAQKSAAEKQGSDRIADNGLQQRINKNPLSANSNATQNETQNTKRNPVALFIPLTDQKSKLDSDHSVESPDIANRSSNENNSAKNTSKDNSDSSSKLVASAPKGELTLPDLASISRVLKDFIRQDSSSEPRANNANDSKDDNTVATKSTTANKVIANASVVPLERSKPVSKSTKPVASENSSKANKIIAKLQPRTSGKLASKNSPIISKGWVVQVGSFSKKSNATKLQNKLSKRGHKSYVELANSKNGIIYRVRVGPQKNQTRAKLVQRKILKQEKLESIVLRYPR